MENGMILLTITATLTSLATEAIKKTCSLDSKKISLNVLAAAVSIICALIVGLSYIILAEIAIGPKIIVYFLALIILSWLSSTVGYDKIKETIKQIGFLK